MPIIRNKLDQRLTINLKSGKNIDLMAKGVADVSDDDLASRHLQALSAKGSIIVIREEMHGKERKPVKTSPSNIRDTRKVGKKEGRK